MGATYGVKGWVKINSYTDPISNILNYSSWFLNHQGEWVSVAVDEVKTHGNGLIAKLAGIDDPETAKQYTNDPIAVPHDLLPELPSDEYYWDDLVGLNVTTSSGVTLGQIIEVRNTGANDVLIIEGDKRHLVPFIDHVIQSVDLHKRAMIVDWDHDF